jgi:hypothetical protein
LWVWLRRQHGCTEVGFKKVRREEGIEDAEVPSGGQESREDSQAPSGGQKGRCNPQKASCSQKGFGSPQDESGSGGQSEGHRQH